MKPKQDPKVEADKLVRDIKRATSAEIESSRTTRQPRFALRGGMVLRKFTYFEI